MSNRKHRYTTNVPLARERLLQIAERLEADGKKKIAREIVEITEHLMTRRPGLRRAPIQRKQVTEEIRDSVLRDLRDTDMPQEEIARKYGIDGGRVSEIGASVRN